MIGNTAVSCAALLVGLLELLTAAVLQACQGSDKASWRAHPRQLEANRLPQLPQHVKGMLLDCDAVLVTCAAAGAVAKTRIFATRDDLRCCCPPDTVNCANGTL